MIVKIRKVHLVASMELRRVNSNIGVGNRGGREAEERQSL